jgi:glycosyltransferase involved in cell wall biosynthesis
MLLDSDYPGADNLYGDVFVHTRVKAYQARGIEVKVVSFFRDIPDYDYEGVQVSHAPVIKDVITIYNEFNPDFVFVHFYHKDLFEFINRIKAQVIVWVHGYEALGWYRRLFNFTPYYFLRNMHNIILPNIRQMKGFRSLVRKSESGGKIRFVFVSKWMKRMAEADAGATIRRYNIIPNPIDTRQFAFQQKNTEHRKKILMIRSFNSRKYANDIAIDAIQILSRKEYFNSLEFSIYGRGKYFAQLTEPLKKFSNVKLYETFLPNIEIAAVHRAHGIFLCPTRQDAQGVSMCEAMSSGLVPVTSPCTAIPEFVDDGVTGLLGKNANKLASQIDYLYHQPERFLSMSKNASAYIKSKCSFDTVIDAELNLMSHPQEQLFLQNVN